jgi:hypothetical protein
MNRNKMVTLRLFGVVLATILITTILGCANFRNIIPRAGTYYGPSRDIGGGHAYTFINIDTNGRPTSIGIRMSDTALIGLPLEPPRDADGWEYMLPLPKEAAISGYNHVGIDWNPKGHIPPGIYDVPHFDFHFYMISSNQREKITAKGEDLAKAHKAPAQEAMPEGYILPEGTEVPRMGAHAIDPTSAEFNKMSFTKTFIYGFYDGSIVFLEPMVSKAFLDMKPNTTDPIKLPKIYSRHAYYPTYYCVKYSTSQREYMISLEGLISR